MPSLHIFTKLRISKSETVLIDHRLLIIDYYAEAVRETAGFYGGFWRFVFGQLRGALQKKICKNAQIGVRNTRKRGKNRPKHVETSPKHRKTSAFLAFFVTF